MIPDSLILARKCFFEFFKASLENGASNPSTIKEEKGGKGGKVAEASFQNLGTKCVPDHRFIVLMQKTEQNEAPSSIRKNKKAWGEKIRG